MALVTYYCNTSAIGDTCCVVPTIRALIADDRLYKVLASTRNCEILRLCGIDERFILDIKPEELAMYDPKGSEIVVANVKGRGAFRIHLVDLFSVFPINAILKPEEKCAQALPEFLPSLPKEVAGRKYIVIGTGYANISRKMPYKVFMEVKDFCKKSGFELVLLGGQRTNSKSPISFEGYPDDGCINLIDKTDIPESVAIMGAAAAVVAVDSGLIYLAALTDVPIVGGYTFVEPYYRLPYRHGVKGWNFHVVEPRGKCKYCSSRLAMFGVEFDTKCPLGKGYECATTLDSKDFLKALKKAVSGRVHVPVPDGE